MKHLRHLALSALLVLALMTSAFAAEVPVNLVVENLNGQQRMVKTYVLPPDIDPETLKEPSFDYDGFTYTWAYTTKEEHTFLETKTVTETVTVETSKKDLTVILDSITYTVVYVGTEIVPEVPKLPQPDETEKTEPPASSVDAGAIGGVILTVLLVLLLAALAGLGVYLFLHRKNVYIYVPGDQPRDYKLIAKFRVEAQKPEADIFAIMTEEKGNQKEAVKIGMDKLRKYFPRGTTPQQMEETIIRLLERELRRKRNRDSR